MRVVVEAKVVKDHAASGGAEMMLGRRWGADGRRAVEREICWRGGRPDLVDEGAQLVSENGVAGEPWLLIITVGRCSNL